MAKLEFDLYVEFAEACLVSALMTRIFRRSPGAQSALEEFCELSRAMRIFCLAARSFEFLKQKFRA